MKKVFVAAAIFLIVGCKKEVSELPAPSQTGAQIFGALIDGTMWVPQGFGMVPTAPILEARYNGNNNYFINARNFSAQPVETEFEIFLKNVTGPGVYPLHKNTGVYPQNKESYGYYVERKLNPTGEWITAADATGSVRVTKIDTVNHILSGTFQFKAKPMSIYPEKKPITVTDGRFDVTIK